jgi:hypothetical protein
MVEPGGVGTYRSTENAELSENQKRTNRSRIRNCGQPAGIWNIAFSSLERKAWGIARPAPANPNDNEVRFLKKQITFEWPVNRPLSKAETGFVPSPMENPHSDDPVFSGIGKN